MGYTLRLLFPKAWRTVYLYYSPRNKSLSCTFWFPIITSRARTIRFASIWYPCLPVRNVREVAPIAGFLIYWCYHGLDSWCKSGPCEQRSVPSRWSHLEQPKEEKNHVQRKWWINTGVRYADSLLTWLQRAKSLQWVLNDPQEHVTDISSQFLDRSNSEPHFCTPVIRRKAAH